ncbi:3-phenylpropionate MFS transporter [Actinobacillus equuli]|uniref:3-phenylpropionate MFS transporter n=1 Tax=Actinobacillus equuli TaxID=718 RepID=UPI0024422947|nr:3-phenylpropionate MFS transporter [Actinobacillus equuli]WGE41333.1 3-phenylpropionate MFS transporter [Actinobacillus equuli subsp. haemolyticus]WGE45705.1 3-phenylpropionate MFS transporter [Actinobacillus equuli subsp. haemolyticus]WGE56267.1 3-phenylpropionate MFS transporter [Actinobacillus equuli subsp. equuli]WGE64480.1 3-phenylpropionate MFS transporter [Actinobacillus equuli subsp. equuli]
MIKPTPFQWSAFNFFGFFCAFGVFLPFMPVWLKHHGYSTEMIGLLASFGYLFRFAGGMLSSQQVKSSNQLIPTARVLTLLNLIAIILIVWSVDSIWLLFPALMLFHIFNAGAMPIGDSIASLWQQQVGIDYGKARLFGSIAFVVGSLSTGYLTGWLGEGSIIWIMFGFFILLGCGQLLTPKVSFENQQDKKSSSNLSYWQILKEPTTLRMMFAVSLILGSHAAYYIYSTIHWSAAGISTQTSSLLWGFAVCAEILFFLFSNRLFKAWRISHLMIIASLVAILRWSILASTTEITLLAISQTFHAITFGMAHYAMIRYISAQNPEKITKLQGLYFALSNCGFTAIFTFISGMLYQDIPNFVFWLMAIIVVPAIFIVPKKFEVKLVQGENHV